MRVMAQLGMVMNLDKCIGCHTCSVTCKQAWTNRTGVEYAWFNNVETRPGLGYPRRWEDQDRWEGGWVRTKSGRLELRSGGRTKRMLRIFSNPTLPGLSDYYEPWTYDYDVLLSAPAQADTPVARPRSLITGDPMRIAWSANWDDDLGGAPQTAPADPVLQRIGDRVRLAFEQAFMFYLPRICEHCLNPSCVAACPSGAMYKRAEDGIVLVDQDGCRGWRMCVSGCPYKKVYFNHRTGKAEKCTFCYPRVEAGQPTICAETCVGRLRYIGLFLYDADRVLAAASVEDPRDLLEAQRNVILDPEDPAVIAAARAAGIAEDWLEAARHSPVYALTNRYRIALPLHPEWRTMPMVWYVPPLSPVVDAVAGSGFDGEDRVTLFGAIDALRIPVEYLAEQLSAGDPAPVVHSLRVLAAMRAHMRRINLGEPGAGGPDDAAAVGYTPRALEELFRLLAVARYEERYVIPAAHVELARSLDEAACSLDYEGGPGRGGAGPFGEPPSLPIAVEAFHLARERAGADRYEELSEVRGVVARSAPETTTPTRSGPAGEAPPGATDAAATHPAVGTAEADRTVDADRPEDVR